MDIQTIIEYTLRTPHNVNPNVLRSMLHQLERESGVRFIIVDELPEVGEANVVYLLAAYDPDEGDIYEEYVWVAETQTYEQLGHAKRITIDDALSLTSKNPVENKVVTKAINDITDDIVAIGETLSSYVTKQELNNGLNNKLDRTNPIISGTYSSNIIRAKLGFTSDQNSIQYTSLSNNQKQMDFYLDSSAMASFIKTNNTNIIAELGSGNVSAIRLCTSTNGTLQRTYNGASSGYNILDAHNTSANPTLSGSEATLTSLKLDGVSYALPTNDPNHIKGTLYLQDLNGNTGALLSASPKNASTFTHGGVGLSYSNVQLFNFRDPYNSNTCEMSLGTFYSTLTLSTTYGNIIHSKPSGGGGGASAPVLDGFNTSANPGLSGGEATLTSLKLNNVSYKIPTFDPTTIAGYDASKSQILTHDAQGVMTWVDATTAQSGSEVTLP